MSTPYVVLTGYPPWQGTPHQGTPWQGTPQQGTPPARVPPWQGTPLARVPPSWTWQGTPQPGYPLPPTRVPPLLDLAGYPPSCPMAFWEMLQSIMGYGYPPVDRQTDTCQNITFPRTTCMGGNKTALLRDCKRRTVRAVHPSWFLAGGGGWEGDGRGTRILSWPDCSEGLPDPILSRDIPVLPWKGPGTRRLGYPSTSPKKAWDQRTGLSPPPGKDLELEDWGTPC